MPVRAVFAALAALSLFSCAVRDPAYDPQRPRSLKQPVRVPARPAEAQAHAEGAAGNPSTPSPPRRERSRAFPAETFGSASGATGVWRD